MDQEDSQSPPSPPLPPAAPSGQAAVPLEGSLSPEVLKSAYHAFKKRWKLTRLDYESKIGRGPMSSGQKSSIVGIVPPSQFPAKVWEELVKQGRLKYAGNGQYSIP